MEFAVELLRCDSLLPSRPLYVEEDSPAQCLFREVRSGPNRYSQRLYARNMQKPYDVWVIRTKHLLRCAAQVISEAFVRAEAARRHVRLARAAAGAAGGRGGGAGARPPQREDRARRAPRPPLSPVRDRPVRGRGPGPGGESAGAVPLLEAAAVQQQHAAAAGGAGGEAQEAGPAGRVAGADAAATGRRRARRRRESRQRRGRRLPHAAARSVG